MANSRAMELLPLLGIIVVVVVAAALPIFMVVRMLAGLGKADAERQRLLRDGVQASAQVLGVQMGGMTMIVHGHRHLQLQLSVKVHAPGRPPYVASMQPMISELQIPQVQPGAMLTVRVDRQNPMVLALEGVGGMVPVDYRVQAPFAAPAAFGAGGYGFGAPGMAMLPIASPQVPAGAKVGLFVGLGGALVGVVVAVVVVLVNVGGVGLDSATEGSDVCAQAARCCELTASGPAAQNCKNLGKLGVPKAACSQSLQSFRDLATSQGKTCR